MGDAERIVIPPVTAEVVAEVVVPDADLQPATVATSGRPAATPLWSRRWGRLLLAWLGVVTALAAWQVAALVADTPILPTFTDVASRLGELAVDGELAEILPPTVGRWLAAFSVSAVLGLGIGVVLARIGVLRALALPVVDFVRAVPATLLVPAAIALLGLGSSMVVAVVVASATWPILISTVDGVSRVDPLTLDSARTCHFRRIGLLRVSLRAAVPDLLAGLRIGLSISLAVLIVAELLGATSGLGYFIRNSQQTFRIVDTYAGVLLLALLGWVLDTGFLTLERRLMAHSYRRGAL